MGYTASLDTLDLVARLVEQERPDWDPVLVKLVLHSHTSLVDGSDLAIAALRAAQNRDLPTPKAIGWRGPHWRDLATQPIEVRAAERCTTCGKPEPRCVMERPGRDDDHRFEPRRSA